VAVITLARCALNQRLEEGKTLLETAIMEVKSNNLDNFNFIDKKVPFPKTRFSKFCNAFEELYNAL